MEKHQVKPVYLRWVFPLLCFLIVGAKLLLVAQNEIISIADDSAGYVRQSLRPWTLDFPPGYSAWLRLGSTIGLPQRVEIELLFLLAAAFVALAVRRHFDSWAGILTLAILAFTPSTFFLFDHALSDSFFTCLTLLALATSMWILLARATGQIVIMAVALGLLIGIMASTRNEDPLIAFWIGSLFLACGFLWREKETSVLTLTFWRKPLIASLVVTACTVLIVISTGLSFYIRDGVFARSISLIPGHLQLLKNLAEIDTGSPQMKFVPISRKSRELAYQVSPTLNRVRGGVEDLNYTFQIASRQSGLPAGELSGGFIWHAINGQMLGISEGRLVNTESLYKKCNRELKAAFDDGRLKRRFVIHPLVGADLVGVLARLPRSVGSVIVAGFDSLPEYAHDQGFRANDFNRALLRRAALIETSPQVDLEGWAFVNTPSRRIRSVVISPDSAKPVEIQSVARPDVEKNILAEKGWKPIVSGFSATVEAADPNDVSIDYVLDDGTRLRSTNLKPLQVSFVNAAVGTGAQVIQGIDLVKFRTYPREGVRHEIQISLLKLSDSSALRWAAVCTVSLAFTLKLFLYIKNRDPHSRVWLILACLVLALWSGRILFYSLLNAAAWDANQIRYLAPAHVLGLVILSISINVLFQFAVRSRWSTMNKRNQVSGRAVTRTI